MNYKLYQIHLTEAEHNQVNAEGHNSVPKHRLKLDMSFTTNPHVAELAKEAMDKGYYTHVSNIEADSLEGVFEVGNIGPESAITRLDKMYSVSVADVVETPEGVRHVVASVGFEQLA
jgi:hypothetical protein